MDTGCRWNDVGVFWRRGNVWVILLLGALALPTANCQEYIAKGCPGGKEDSPPVDVTLTCPDGQVISLGEAKFGRNKYTHCTITDGDCLDKTDAFIGCQGRHNCTVHFDRPFSPTCGYVSFITVTYDCLAVTSTPPSTTVLTSAPAYSVTPTSTAWSTRQDHTHSGVGKTGESGEDNTALIAGCVVAVVITVVLLIIAIVLVVRRLACGADLSDDEEKKSTSCHILPCLQVEHGENSPKPREEAADCHGSTDTSDKKRTKRKRKRGGWADKNQNMSPRLAPVGQEDEEDSPAHTAIMAPPLRSSVHSDAGAAGGSSARSSVAMETSAQLKRHSSGAKSAGSDSTREHGAESHVSEMDDFSSWGEGGEGKGVRKGAHMPGRTVGSSSRSGKMSTTSFSAPSQDRAPPCRMPKPATDQHAPVKSKQRHPYDAVAVPNTETFTSC